MLCPQFGQRQLRYILLLSSRFQSRPGTRGLALHAVPMLLRRHSAEQRRALLHEAFELPSPLGSAADGIAMLMRRRLITFLGALLLEIKTAQLLGQIVSHGDQLGVFVCQRQDAHLGCCRIPFDVRWCQVRMGKYRLQRREALRQLLLARLHRGSEAASLCLQRR